MFNIQDVGTLLHALHAHIRNFHCMFYIKLCAVFGCTLPLQFELFRQGSVANYPLFFVRLRSNAGEVTSFSKFQR